ncbi:phage head closure protein [Devosia sp.]|uniref:phage head closure protein n=1 Tax=Devosia sp. TaxID=1871048 RepID=UPI001AC4224F|nr:phage head closure protein [Devosia sp.]MBN9332978.1 phage head closure protein [Devosia sp.]
MNQSTPSLGTLTDRIQVKLRLGDGYENPQAMWARVRALSGTDLTHSVVIRFRSDVQAGDLVIYRGRKLEVIEAKDLNGRRAYLQIAAREAE